MTQLLSSVSVVLSPKKEHSSEPLISKVINLDVNTGSSISYAAFFINKNPLIKPLLSKYNIISLTFKYSDL